MRIALVHMRHRVTGGTQGYLNQLAAFLAGRGHEVTIVCRTHEAPPHPGVRFVVLRGPALGGAWRLWAFARAVERHALGAYDVVMGLGKTWTHDVLRLGGGCHRTYLERAHAATLTRAERLLFQGRLKHALAVRIEERALAPGACRKVITNSEMVRRDVMRRYGVAAAAIETIPNGVDLERFHPRHRGGAGGRLRRALGLGDEALVVLFLGNGFGRKGLDLLLGAFPALLRERREARLLVVGQDSAEASYRAHAERAGLARAVRFLGGRADPEACYGAANLYALPTRYDPFANSTLEALASGLPVVTTAANGCAELLTPGLEGSVLEGGADGADLLEALLQWADADRRREAALAARKLAERHGVESKLEATERVLLEVAAARRP